MGYECLEFHQGHKGVAEQWGRKESTKLSVTLPCILRGKVHGAFLGLLQRKPKMNPVLYILSPAALALWGMDWILLLMTNKGIHLILLRKYKVDCKQAEH